MGKKGKVGLAAVAAPEIVTLPAEDELHYEARTPFMKRCKRRWRTDDDF